jgi:N-acetylglucosaminyldiphosphoundecaprenol N-acetyl-beta-D-mannosaminyltransferase
MQPSPANLLPIETRTVLGSPLALTDYAGAVALTQQWAAEGLRPYAVAAANTHVVTLARHDREFRDSMDKFDLLLPDGMPLVWCMNRAQAANPAEGTQLKDRVYGPTFMLRCLEASGEQFTHFLLGGSEELLADLQAKLRSRFPKLRIAGTYSPPFGKWPEEENERIFEAIRASKAQYIWIGLGCPKQEHWLARNKDRLPPGVYGAVGAAFAFHAGRVRQAPSWIQARGLEWAFRLAAEPRRLFKRYVTFNSLFLFYLALEALGGDRQTPRR